MSATSTEKLEALRRFAADLVGVTVPEIDLPTYVLPADSGDVLALTGGLLAYEYRENIENAGLWRGWGFCALVNLDQVEDFHTGTAVLIHEFAHFAINAGWTSVLLSTSTPEALLRNAPEPAEATRLACQHLDALPPWTGHGAAFVRLLIHVVRRVQAAGWFGDENDAVPSDCYLLSRPSRYAEHLGDEPQRLADVPLFRIPTIAPPQEYTDFAASNLAQANEHVIYLNTTYPKA